MDDTEFAAAADAVLHALSGALETALAEDDTDIDLRGGILTLELDDGRKFIVNKHGPTRQIWLASPVSGASHYAFDAAAGNWRSTRGPQILHAQLAGDLAAALGHPVALG
jgi:frataxin